MFVLEIVYATKNMTRTKRNKIDSVDWMVHQNRGQHRTNDFEDVALIVRRGFPVSFKTCSVIESVSFSAVTSSNNGDSNPRLSKPKKAVTEVLLSLKKPNISGWVLQCSEKQDTEEHEYSVTPPANCVVGNWVASVKVGGEETSQGVIILFNPFCEKDQVYMENLKEQEEYVMTDTGLVFGAASWKLKPEGWGWIFGQFDSQVLYCCLHLLDKSSLSTASKSSAVLISRAMSAMVNAQDDDGVLVGNWSGDYSDGIDPSEWGSSVDILLKYYKTKKPVRYGQCWVFSGVLVTVLRALGIPCRSVTNYRSAHDTELNMAIDIFHDKNGDKIESDDSVWNFHLWNEIWTKRPDLPTGYDGWQALDATPQEMSDGLYQAGPSSLKAIKAGAVYLPYDARFIFAEVNADRVYWHENEDGDYEIKKIDKTHVGKMVVTKAVGSNKPAYITDLYKHKEGSQEERHQTRLAVTFGTEPDLYEYTEQQEEIDMKFDCDFDYIVIGEPVHYNLELKLNNLPSAKVVLTATASIYSYNGKFIGRVGSQQHSLQLPEQSSFTGTFLPEEYAPHANFRSFLKISLMYNLVEQNDMGFLEEEIPLRAPPPTLTIDGQRPFPCNQPVQLTFSFTNKFLATLTGGYFKLNAPGFSSRKLLYIKRDLPQGESCTYTLEYTPRRRGEVNLVVSFSSDQHKGLQGYNTITVS